MYTAAEVWILVTYIIIHERSRLRLTMCLIMLSGSDCYVSEFCLQMYRLPLAGVCLQVFIRLLSGLCLRVFTSHFLRLAVASMYTSIFRPCRLLCVYAYFLRLAA